MKKKTDNRNGHMVGCWMQDEHIDQLTDLILFFQDQGIDLNRSDVVRHCIGFAARSLLTEKGTK